MRGFTLWMESGEIGADNVFEEFVLSGRERQELKLRGRALMDRAGVSRSRFYTLRSSRYCRVIFFIHV